MSKKCVFNHGDAIARARKARERLGVPNPACSVCGEDRPVILERHHVAGKDYDPATGILCRNHHGLLTDAQKDFPDGTDRTHTYVECMGRMLLNLAELLALLVPRFREYGTYLIELAKAHRGKGVS